MDSVDTALNLAHLGRREYEPVWRAMQNYTSQRGNDDADWLLLVEHPPIFTLGQAARPEHVLAPGKIPVLQVDRGGQVTYHGPGQAVLYPLIDLRRRNLGIRAMVDLLEQSCIDLLLRYSIDAERREGAPGVYVDQRKIASIGLRVRRGCTFHGLAFNVDMDLEPFQRINPCGYAGLEVTDLARLGGPGGVESRGRELAAIVAELLGSPLANGTDDPISGWLPQRSSEPQSP